jgi:hypothetical protein
MRESYGATLKATPFAIASIIKHGAGLKKYSPLFLISTQKK